MADFSLTQQELDAILRGEATAGDLLGARQAQAQGGTAEGLSPAAQQYLATFQGGNDYLGETANQYNQIPGYADVKPGYKVDDYLAGAKFKADQAEAAGKAGYQTWMDQQNLDLKRQAAEQASTAKFSSPDADLLMLQLRGLTPEDIANAFSSGDKADIDTLMTELGAVDKDGMPDYSPTNIQRLAHIEQYRDNLQSQVASEDDARRKRTRLQSLTPELRAKEAYLQLQNPGQKVVVNPNGQAFHGEDAEAEAMAAMEKLRPKAPAPEIKATNYGQPKPKPGEGPRGLRTDISKGQGPLGTAVKFSPWLQQPLLYKKGVEKAVDVAPAVPGAARKAWSSAWNYLKR